MGCQVYQGEEKGELNYCVELFGAFWGPFELVKVFKV